MLREDLSEGVTCNYHFKDEKKPTVTGQEVESLQGRGNKESETETNKQEKP